MASSYTEALDDAPEARFDEVLEEDYFADIDAIVAEDEALADGEVPRGYIFAGFIPVGDEESYWEERDEYREWAGMEWTGGAWQ